MCGVLGWLGEGVNKNLSNFESALNVLSHRGPDDEGVWEDTNILLGHRRLSIIDLSQAGHQPMIDNQSGSIIIFNGEIYNYLELAEELKKLGYKFKGNSDTEVLLYSLVEWGPNVISKLNGMWAFAFWSPKKNQLILSRDRFGVKPLYFHQSKNNFAFASEPKGLLNIFPKLRSINENVLLDFLKNNSLYTENKSFYNNIDVFPQAHYGIYEPNNRKFNLIRYWDYPKSVNNDISEEEAIDEFSVLLKDSVRLRLRSDVSVGVTLSGGLDSTGILAATNSEKKKPINCYTSVYEEDSFDEYKWAEIASKNVECKLTPVISKQTGWLDALKKITWHLDAPNYSPAVFPIWNIMKYSRSENVPVLLDGQGADESLGGYAQYSILNLLESLSFKNNEIRNLKFLLKHLRGVISTFGLIHSLSFAVKETSPKIHSWYRRKVGFQSLLLDEFCDSPHSKNNEVKSYSVRDRLINDHSSYILPGLLHYGDALSMSHGIEVRNPFLDYRLVEWIFKLPNNILFNNNETKSILRQFLRNNKQIDISHRADKKGYPTPVGKWLASNEIEQLLLSEENSMLQWCDKKKIKKLIHLNRRGVKTAESNLYKLLSSQLWIKECIKN
ncbi:asparagine synthase (glutamine-hydrolyzing) [Candidatus Pelagibacter sp.]|nr:asparagine synthase (glutamine-hydrolyzing) [Candidatus Pelagibacter sp.]